MKTKQKAPWLLAAAALAISCGGGTPKNAAELAGGDPQRGRAAIVRYGCHTCHAIPGVGGAGGGIGPSLAGIGRRVNLGGVLPNTPRNLMAWIQDPPAHNERTAMPNMGVTEGDARDIASYLYNVKEGF